jgi:magnesium chelatase subunit I
LSRTTQELPRTFRQSSFSEDRLAGRFVKDELRGNLICKIQRGDALFPGILGYEDTVVPQIVNAILSQHHFILLKLSSASVGRLLAPELCTVFDGALSN